jgi:hypothetical protein
MTVFSERVDRWREQAEEYRTLAQCAKTLDARDTNLTLAADCDALARRFAETVDAAKRDGMPTF